MEHEKRRAGWNVHFGSMVVGFLLALCLVLAVGAATGNDSTGQYRISSGSDLSAFIIDTQNGHVWQISQSDNIDLGTPLDRKSVRESITSKIR